MAPKTIKRALKDMLAKLSNGHFASFCDELLDCGEEPQVFKSSVEDKSRLEIADLLVSTFTEARAVQVAVKILGEISCNEVAKQLDADTCGLLPASGSSDTQTPRGAGHQNIAQSGSVLQLHQLTNVNARDINFTVNTYGAGPSAGAAAVPSAAEEEHFVDKHRKQLVDRVSNIKSILDDLLQAKVLTQGVYAAIMVIPTTEDKVRELYNGPLKAGRTCKDIFLKALEDNEKHLIDELKTKK